MVSDGPLGPSPSLGPSMCSQVWIILGNHSVCGRLETAPPGLVTYLPGSHSLVIILSTGTARLGELRSPSLRASWIFIIIIIIYEMHTEYDRKTYQPMLLLS